jgi:hypothetical protein
MRILLTILALLATVPFSYSEQTWKIETDVVIYEAVVAGTAIKVVISEQAFNPANHQITEPQKRGTEEDPIWVAATIDGKPVVGTDQTVPPKGLPQLARIVVYFGDKQVEIPASTTSHVFIPHDSTDFSVDFADTIISVSSDAKCVLIDMAVGDGGGTSSAFFSVSADGKTSTKPPNRPES